MEKSIFSPPESWPEVWLDTEVWELENGNNKLIEPYFLDGTYAWGIGLYLVDNDFCKK